MLSEGEMVRGVVVRREPFGVFVDIGEPEPGVLLVDAVSDGDPSSATQKLPDVGDHIEAVFLGYGLPRGTQPRLSIRPSDLAKVQANPAG